MADPMAAWQNGFFALPPGVDFACEVVRGVVDRMAGHPPEAIARVTIYANAAGTLSALREAFDSYGPMLLPQMRTVADLRLGVDLAAQPVTAPLARRLQLARLIDGLIRARPDMAAGHSIAVLASSLAGLMGEMQSEGLDVTALEGIDTGDHARHWQNALAFLRIAAEFHLTAPLVDPAARQRAGAEACAHNWARGENLPQGPVIVVGSTGSHGATQLFMQAVAALPQGAVVLPGFDFDQSRDVWDRLNEGGDDHPQARFAPFIKDGGLPRRWTDKPPPAPDRNRLMSLALRPAPITDQWIAEGPRLPPLGPVTQGLTLIEADQPGTEAEAIALVMREAVERDEKITLIAADAGLIRRVNAALDLWHLRPDDSAGQPLDLTASGLFLRQVAGLFGKPLDIHGLLTVLKHPLTGSGSASVPTNEARRAARDLELHLRRKGPAFPDGRCLREWGETRDGVQRTWARWLADLVDRITPLARDAAARPLPDRLADLRRLADDLAAGADGDVARSELWHTRPGMLAHAVMDQLTLHAGEGPAMRPGDFAVLLTTELQRESLRIGVGAHPLLRIIGPRETRLHQHGTVILSGLNEGGWPHAPSPDPWLSRQMRAQAGLTSPERLIGLAAHDFQQGMGADRVILTRAKRDAEAETIPSRWLNRLVNLLGGLPDRGGPEALAAMRARGRVWTDMAAALSRPAGPVAPAPRPSPIPPAPAFAKLPVTDIAHLIRDPYAVYAKRVLRLRPLNSLLARPDAALRGQTLHSIVEALMKTHPTADTPPEKLRDDFLRLTDEVLETDVPWPSARIFWRARMAAIADRIVADELARRARGAPVVVEREGAVSLEGMGFSLTAKPDRIDLTHQGQAVIYDYKSGNPPTDAQIRRYDKQLLLEAGMARRGGFDALGPVEVEAVRYIQLGGEGATLEREHSDQLEAETWDGFVRLVATYLAGGKGFTAMQALERTSFSGDYDHLARFGEWSLADLPQSLKVGDHG